MTKADAAYNTRTPTAGQISNARLNQQSRPPDDPAEPTATRRGALASLTGGAFLAAGGAAEAANPDAGLIALGERYFEALARSEAALDRFEECDAAYDAAVPIMPDALILRREDVGDLAFPIRDQIVGCYLEARHVELLRAKPRRRRAPAYWRVERPAGPATLVAISRTEFEGASANVEVVETSLMQPCPIAQARADENRLFEPIGRLRTMPGFSMAALIAAGSSASLANP